MVKAFVGQQKENYLSTIFNYNDDAEAPTSCQSFRLLEEATDDSRTKEFCGTYSPINVETMEIGVAFVKTWKSPIPFTLMNNFIFHFNSGVFFGHARIKQNETGTPEKFCLLYSPDYGSAIQNRVLVIWATAFSLLLFQRVTTWVMEYTHQNTREWDAHAQSSHVALKQWWYV